MRQFAPLGGGPGAAAPHSARSVRQARSSTAAAVQQICPSNPAQPLIEPEARTVMNVDAAEQIADGTGIKVGIIADGIDPNNPDLIRANGQHVIFDYQDFSGFGPGAPTDGREAFLNTGTIASQANQTYDLSGFVNPAHPLPPGCDIKIKGIAPGASLAVLNVASSDAEFFNSQIIQAIRARADLNDHVDVLNESIGGNPIRTPRTTRSPWPTRRPWPQASRSWPAAATPGRSTTSANRLPPGVIAAVGTTTCRSTARPPGTAPSWSRAAGRTTTSAR